MNPKTTIWPWLMLCSKQGGIGAVEAFEIEAPDMSGKEEEIYFTFLVKKGKPFAEAGKAPRPARGKSLPDPAGYDVDVSGSQQWEYRVEIELHNSQNGLAELAGCAVAAEVDQDLLNLFKGQSVSFVSGSAEVENLSTRDGAREHHEHKMTCRFNAGAGFTHRKTNHRVETIDLDDAITLATE